MNLTPRLTLTTCIFCCLLLTLLIAYSGWSLQETPSPFRAPVMREMPITYQGRFRPMEAYSRLWLHQRYGYSSLRETDLAHFSESDGSALDILWRWTLEDPERKTWPLFWISPAVRTTLTQAVSTTHLSYQQIEQILLGNHPSSLHVWNLLLTHHAKSLTPSRIPQELPLLAQGLFVLREKDAFRLTQVPPNGPASHLKVASKLLFNDYDPTQIQGWVDLVSSWSSLRELKLVPPHNLGGNWLSLEQAPEAIQQPLQEAKEALQSADASTLNQSVEKLSTLLWERYTPLAGKRSLSSPSVELYYPTHSQLWAESTYVRLPVISLLLFCYVVGTLALFISYNRATLDLRPFAFFALGLGWMLHTLLLATRCYILGRPPVSNMFETLLYVPWICMLVGFIAEVRAIGYKTLLAASSSAILLLSLIPLTGMQGGMENVQAVLDSRYWLIVHVLMVVGSYGAFFVSGLLAHGFLVGIASQKLHPANAQRIERSILITLYVGVALLIPGTLLGGVWAAQSWGRFWDWDPKESWACITSAIYLFVIHLYRFGRIQAIGLAFGSILGMLAVSFTWYGVNYLLGVGLHSYGFGHGGETAYLGYLLAEALFLLTCFVCIKNHKTGSLRV